MDFQKTEWETCRLCRVSEESAPGVADPSGWLCARCYLDEKGKDPDVRFFLDTIEKQIPEAERGGRRGFHHTVLEWLDAVKSVTRVRDMKRFFRGCSLWYSGPGLTRQYCEAVTRHNIGFAMNEASLWTRLKWWWAVNLRKSDTFHL